MDVVDVEGASSGLERLDRAREQGRSFDLLLLDANMPGTDGFGMVERLRTDRDDDPVVVMLTSAGRAGERQRCRELGIDSYLTKPVHQADLLDSIGQALARARVRRAAKSSSVLEGTVPEGTVSEGTVPEGAVPEGTVSGRAASRQELAEAPGQASARHREELEEELEPATRRLQVLLAEDNVVNVKVAVATLEKRGHEVTVAANGNEVLEALGTNADFDLILMDLEMPELDGLEATTAIRRRERDGDVRIPIIGVSAHAMDEHRDRCLEAGMDAYLTKPFRARELVEAVEGSVPEAV